MACYMKISGVDGGVSDASHKGWVLFDTMISNIHRTIKVNAKDQEKASGSTTLTAIGVTRRGDKASLKLKELCATGTFIPEIEIHVCNTLNGEQVPKLKYKLSSVILGDYTMEVKGGVDSEIFESISLNYSKVQWTWTEFDGKTGGRLGDFVSGYDADQNKRI
jgi:type VI secretion system Hcp family effector